MRYIVITGNPVDGFNYFGPFKDRDEALAWAESSAGSLEWWVTWLQDAEQRP